MVHNWNFKALHRMHPPGLKIHSKVTNDLYHDVPLKVTDPVINKRYILYDHGCLGVSSPHFENYLGPGLYCYKSINE